jgi:hypothetical protein
MRQQACGPDDVVWNVPCPTISYLSVDVKGPGCYPSVMLPLPNAARLGMIQVIPRETVRGAGAGVGSGPGRYFKISPPTTAPITVSTITSRRVIPVVATGDGFGATCFLRFCPRFLLILPIITPGRQKGRRRVAHGPRRSSDSCIATWTPATPKPNVSAVRPGTWHK